MKGPDQALRQTMVRKEARKQKQTTGPPKHCRRESWGVHYCKRVGGIEENFKARRYL